SCWVATCACRRSPSNWVFPMRMPLPGRSAAGRASRLRAIGKPGAESLSVSQIQLLMNLLLPLPRIERLAEAGLVGQLAMLQADRAGIGMCLAVLFVLDVQHLHSGRHQYIGNDRAVAAPPEHLGAHYRGTVPRSQFLQAGQAPGEFGTGHMVGVAAEGGIAPGRVGRVGREAAPAAEFRQQLVMDARRLQAVSQRLLAELRQAAGARKAPHVRQDLYSVMAQQGDEVLDRAGRMAQGPDGLRLGHVT